MNREILFRGKATGDGQWAYGDLRRDEYGTYIYDNRQGTQVDPETVGEFTGLTDKNGTKVFEGDIVEFDVQSGKTRDVVVWSDGEYNGVAGFRLKSRALYSITSYNRQYFEVVGNVCDNADLLEGKNGQGKRN